MRLRNLKDKDILLKECSYLIHNPIELKSKWNNEFGNKNPIHLEIGMGKGDFIYNMAKLYPDINFIGVEKYSGVLARAVKKYPLELPNLRFVNIDALLLNDIFDKEIDTIYLNFSDPWPKKRHKERRLTSNSFLNIYDNLFKNNKIIIMKTDNIGLFASSIINLSNYGYILKEVNLDLANSDISNVCTEYENKFMKSGIKINYLVAEKNEN